MNPFLVYWLPWYAYLALIFFLSSIPRPDQALGFEIKDFFAHPLEYFFLPLLTFRAFRQSRYGTLKNRFLVRGVLFCLFYAATDEFHQLFVPHRSGCLVDVLYDSIGIGLGTVLYHFFGAGGSSGDLSA